MQSADLHELREFCTERRIMLCFNGPMSRSLIEEIGNALRNHLEADRVQPGAAMDVFAVYIELTQNIRHYAARMNYGEEEASATVVIARHGDGRHEVSAGNVVEAADAEALMHRIADLAPLDRAALKARYKEQLRAPRDPDSPSGAGLGLIDVARKSSGPLQASLHQRGDGRAFFSLTALI
ncbi:MAG: biofilm regulation protein kinase SiaB [Xanthomonadales bacterium]|nr:biofilm regulation protein kinase SiaB [Xanthomonadales bacterium]